MLQDLQSSEKKNTNQGYSLVSVQVQLGYYAEGQHQDNEIDHALEDPRDQPKDVVVDAVFGIGVAVQPRPF